MNLQLLIANIASQFLERETLGAASVGGTLGAFNSVTILWTGWGTAIPDGGEVIHTVILASIGAIVAILSKILFRWLFPRKK